MQVLSPSFLALMCQPVIFKDAKKLFDFKKEGDDFFNQVKKDASVKKQSIGRVTDLVSTAVKEKLEPIVKRFFVNNIDGTENSDLKGQMVVGPCYTAAYQANPDAVSRMDPTWWATGPHHETTNFEPHKLGSLRIMFSGTRTFACVNGIRWIGFCRRASSVAVPKAKGKGKKGDGSDPSASNHASSGHATLASMSSNLTYQEAKLRFRNLTEVNLHVLYWCDSSR